MKFDRIALAALLALGMGVTACDSDDDKKDEGEKPSQEQTKDEGLTSCKATVTYDEAGKTASATVETVGGKDVKKMVICASKSSKIEAVMNVDIVDKLDKIDTSSYTDAGDYGCMVVVKADGKTHICSADGKLLQADDTHKTLGDVALASFKVESTVSNETLAKWTFASLTTENVSDSVIKGVAADEGSKKDDLKLNWILVGDAATALKMTMDANSAMTALQVKPAGENDFAETQKAAENSHLAISDLSGYAVSKMSMTMSYGKQGGKVYVTAESADSEALVEAIDVVAEDGKAVYKEYTVSKEIPAGTKTIRLYGSKIASSINIDDITIEGAAK